MEDGGPDRNQRDEGAGVWKARDVSRGRGWDRNGSDVDVAHRT